MTNHELKTWPEYFEALRVGDKNFELRKNDRGFKVGDTVTLREWDPWKDSGPEFKKQGTNDQRYTGRTAVRGVTYVLENFEGIAPGFCILSLGELSEHTKETRRPT